MVSLALDPTLTTKAPRPSNHEFDHSRPRQAGKIVAHVLEHANVDTTSNVNTQVLAGSVRTAVETVGEELFRIVQSPAGASERIH